NEFLSMMDDSAVLPPINSTIAMTTDSYVVDPIFFPGGDIGSLAVHGTINDLCMQGATPLYITAGLILEEGFPLEDLERIANSMGKAALKAGVKIVAGDTKVVPRGHADKIFINTSGIGIIPEGLDVGAHNARPGDLILINGPIADHGVTILTKREGLDFEGNLFSDSAPLNLLVSQVLKASIEIHVLRDPTRGGIASALNEIAQESRVGIELFEEQIPVRKEVQSACEILGLDPLYIANEGKAIIFLAEKEADNILKILRKNEHGREAAIIGRVTESNPGSVILKTRVGGTRIVTMLTGEQLPRIC
ncbi:MAG: hydrogenase expression/formation protein HypE, partial [Deltaproteobacteria bacterium]